MNLNRRFLPLTGILILAGAFMQAAIGAPGSIVGFKVLSEEPISTTTPTAPTEDVPPALAWQGNDEIVITTAGYQNCPVLPSSITTADDALTIGLVTVPGDLACGTTLEHFTTVIRLEGWKEDHRPRLEVHEDRA